MASFMNGDCFLCPRNQRPGFLHCGPSTLLRTGRPLLSAAELVLESARQPGAVLLYYPHGDLSYTASSHIIMDCMPSSAVVPELELTSGKIKFSAWYFAC